NLKLSNYKNYILAVVLLSLATLAFWVFKRDSAGEDKPYAKVSLSISTDAIPDSIRLLGREGNSDFLALQNGSFYFNNTVRVKPELEEALVVILKKLEVRRPISGKMHESLSTSIDTAGVQVDVYQKDELLSTFEIWGDKEH